MDSPATERAVGATLVALAAGTDALESTRILRGELGEPHAVPLPELPEFSPGTTPLARTVTHLESLHTELSPHGWRLTGSRVGDSLATRKIRGAQASLLALTADVLEGADAGLTVLRVAGPATLAARVGLPSGEPVLSDPGATHDLAEAWIEGMAALASQAGSAVPGASPVLRVEEPELDAVLTGRVRSSSRYRSYAPLERTLIEGWWRELAGRTQAWFPFDPRTGAVHGAAAHVLAAPDERPAAWENVAELVESGHDVVLNLPAPTPGAAPRKVSERALALAVPWRQIGVEAAALSRLRVSLVPAAELDPARLRAAAVAARDLADALDVVRHDDLDALL